MKKLYKSIRIAIGALFLSALGVSCLPDQESMGGAGQTLVKLSPADFSLLALDAKSVAQSGSLFEVCRVVNSEAALATSTTVVPEYDESGAILDKYNTANATSFIPLPASLGTTDPAVIGGKVVLEFAPGEFSKSVMLNVPDTAAFDFTQQYAFAFKLTEVTGTGKKSAAINDTVVPQVLVKNKYDGKYVVTANSPMVDIVVNTLTGWYPFTFELETSGEHSVTCLLPDPA
jgi:hypothetical protein